MKKSRGIAGLLGTILMIALLAYTVSFGWGGSHSGAMKNIKLGLDLAGGVSITYQTKEKNPSDEDMRDTVYKLQKRVETYSTEASVYQEGDRRISISIPGVSDANEILEELGQPGTLEFQTSDGETVLTGSDIKTAEAKSGQDHTTGANEYMVELQLNKEGSKKFAEATKENIGNQISIIYDGETISSPRVNEAISTSLYAGAVGLAVVILFMMIVYLLPGLASGLALLIYTGLVLMLLNAFDITLSLPGIAGIILSIGMAVDANVIIFARVKEEISAGKSVRNALKGGFHKALSAIVDGNVTTLIAAAVLWFRGSGTVRGFAQTLALGIVISMFTALVITRMIVYSFYAVGIRDEKFYAKKWKERKPVNFLSKKALCFAISLAVIVVGFGVMGYHQIKGNGMLNYSLEFQGGTSTNVAFHEDYSISEIESEIVPVIEEATGDSEVQTQKVKESNQIIIRTKALSLQQREALNQALADKFEIKDSEITYSSISSTISAEMRQDAVIAVVISTICMLLYIWLRFKDIRFATSAVAALVHDVLVVLAFYAVSRITVGSTFIACMLTIVGYSINATIVIFDRIREELKVRKKKESLAELVNRCITLTLTRSIYTSLTTFIMVFFLFLFGVASVREFALPLMAGIICGAYSSVCITGALWYVMKTKVGKKKEAVKTETGKKK
ncbi:protein translocase subunit SecF [Sellimonas intestinalis]|uniref:protein translocase subunit SecF n=1 Tax=Sellimonas intestinalis TaxID=1653434 RepID=UPI003992BC5F